MTPDIFLLLSVPVLPLLLAIPLLHRHIPRFEYLAVLPVFMLFFFADDELVELPWLLLGTGFESSFETRLMLLLSTLFWIPAAHTLSAANRHHAQDIAADFRSTFYLLTLAGYLGAVLTTDLVGFFTFSTLMGYGFYGLLVNGAERAVKRAARVYLCFIVAADLLLFEALLVAASETRDLGFETVHEVMAVSDSLVLYMAMVLPAFALKAAIWPLHYWLVEVFHRARLETVVMIAGVPVAVAMLGVIRWLPLGEIAIAELGMFISSLGMIAIVYAVLHALWRRQLSGLIANVSIIATGMFTIILGAGWSEPSRWIYFEPLLTIYIACFGSAISLLVMFIRWLQIPNHTVLEQSDDALAYVPWFENVALILIRQGSRFGYELLPNLRTSCHVFIQNSWQPGHWRDRLQTAEHILQRWSPAITLFLLLGIVVMFLFLTG